MLLTILLVIVLLFALTIVVCAAGYWLNQGGFMGFMMWYNLMELAGYILAAIIHAIAKSGDS